ncbi:MAG: glycosyltransferase [Lachnospiraceae bacterium]|nr:glycosyltransferase [Lachnospiraceae bacterium]
MKMKALLVANSASMIDHFNRDNIKILKSLGYDIDIAANFQSGNSSSQERINAFSNELKEDGMSIIDLPIPRSIFSIKDTLKCIKTLKNYLSSNPCEIIHCQTPFGGLVARIAAKKYFKREQTKVIYFAHGFHFFKGAPLVNKLVYYHIEKYLSKYTNCLITLNNEDYTSAIELLDAETVRYVPGIGVDCDYISSITIDKEAKKKELGIPVNNKVILNVSELIPRKNIEQTINVFAKAHNTDCTLLICGKGAELNKLKELAEGLGIADKVLFAGYRTDILEIYKACDIFLFTSRQEGLPVSIMQAMASGLPVIASDIRGNNDLLTESGKDYNFNCLVPLDKEDEFVSKLNQLICNTELSKDLGVDNKIICKEKFDIKIVHRLMEKIYRNLL